MNLLFKSGYTMGPLKNPDTIIKRFPWYLSCYDEGDILYMKWSIATSYPVVKSLHPFTPVTRNEETPDDDHAFS